MTIYHALIAILSGMTVGCLVLLWGMRDKRKRKRKNDEIDTRYRWVIAPTRIKIEDIPVHQWKDDDERKRFFALIRETTVPEERPEPFATTRSKK